MHAERFDPHAATDADWAAFTDLVRATSSHDSAEGFPPPLAYLRQRHRHYSASHPIHVWVLRDGAAFAGKVEAYWLEGPDNRDRAWISLDVRDDDPAVTDALLRTACEYVAALGRTTIAFDVPEGSALSALVRERGGRLGSAEEHNVLPLDRASRDDIASLVTAVDGYELVTWDGACPDALLEPFVALMNTMNTAPRDDLTMEDVLFSEERVRDFEDGIARRGHEMWTVVARHVASGELAAYTQLVVRPEWPEVAEQEDTAVAVGHRGHGLGLVIKAANILRLLDERPEAKRVVTWNAASNAHMLRVNRRLGFVCEHRWESWEISAAALAGASA